MKRSLLKLSLALAMFVSAVSAQAQDFEVGFKGGMTVSTISGLEDMEANVGYSVGALVNFVPTERISLGVEVLYQNQGVSYDTWVYDYDYGDYVDGYVDMDYNYLNVPIMLGFNPLGGLWFKAGVQFGFLMNVQYVEYAAADDYELSREKYSPSELDINTVDISIPIAVAWDIVAGFSLEARYAFGITDLYKHAQADVYHNNVFSLTAGIRF